MVRGGLYNAGGQPEALQIFKKVFATDPHWYKLIDRLPAADWLAAEDVPRIKAVGK
ncbi:hypothetical protein L0156_30890 [bacterium]|nr:hypothetical protein [bacterium]